MRKTVVSILSLFIILFVFVSCDPDAVIQQPTAPKSPAIRGTVSIPSAANLSGSDFYVRVMEGEKAVHTGKVNADGSFVVQGLDESKTYSILLTTAEPGDINDSSRDISRAATSGYGGWLSNVTASIDEKAGVGSVKVKPLGTIKGKATRDGASDGYDTMVYIPGTSFMAMTDGEGNFSITSVPQSQNYTLRYSSSGYLSQMKTGVVLYSESDTENPVTTVGDMVLVKNVGSLSGIAIMSGASDNSGVSILLTSGTTSYVGRADEMGNFLITGIEPGTYTATVSATGYISQNVRDLRIEASVTTSMDTITLKNYASRVSGKVTLEGTEDNVGISVMLKNRSVQYDATTDQDGEYLMSRVNPGEYTFIVSKSGYVTKTVEGVVVEASTTIVLDSLRLIIGSRSVTGTVQLELRTDHSGALVTATNLSDPSLVYSAISNSDGNYTLAGMRPGEYSITVSSSGYSTTTLPTVDVLEGSTMSIDSFVLPIARGTINGAVDLEGRSSNAGVKAELMKGTEVYETVYSDDSGSYSFNVPQGNYSGVRLSCENFKSVAIAQSIALIANDCVAIDNGSTTQMVATHVPVIRGRVTVSGLLDQDYSGIKVSLEGTELATETDHDGYWTFTRVPVGDYTLRFERLNTRDVTKQISVRAMAEMNVETLALEPNAASIEGHVSLNSISDYSNITVRATADGASELRTTTNAAGYFYIGNVITTKTYTVTFEKDGWVSQNLEISGLENLSLNDITESHPIELVDTTAPVITGLVVNTGSSDLEGRKLSVHMNITESGSGVSKVYVNTTDDFTGIEGQDYASPFTCHVPDVAGDYTLYVKVQDKAGNMSAVSSSAFRVAEYRTVVSGVLVDNEDGVRDNVITWTKQGSPYYVTSSVLIDENTTLNIEAGVNVQFSGAYYMQVEGKLNINGTDAENVYLYGVGTGEDNWTGIKGVKDNGSTIRHANVTGMAQGLQGYLRVVDSTISATGTRYALGGGSSYFYGTVENSDITGSLYCSGSSLLHNDINSTYRPSAFSSYYSLNSCYLSGNQFTGFEVSLYESSGENNRFSNMGVRCEKSCMLNATFENCALYLTNGGAYIRCEFDGCTFSEFSPAMVKDSNLTDCGVITITTGKTTYERLDMTGNYWGVNNTSEINTKGVNSNLSFIVDYYEDFNKTKVDVSGYVAAPLSNVGYLGDSYYPETVESAIEYSIGDVGPAGGWVFYDKGYYSDGWRYLECAPSDMGRYVFGYYRATDDSDYLATGTATSIGSGRLNTAMLVETMGDNAYSSYDKNVETTSEYAAKKCLDYTYGGYDDWFLPSKDELNLLIKDLHKAGLGSFGYGDYWSSSEYYDNLAWSQNLYNGNQFRNGRNCDSRVCAVRAF